MAIKVIAQHRVLKIGKNPGVKKFVMRPDLYIPIQEKKVLKEASVRSGIAVGALPALFLSQTKRKTCFLFAFRPLICTFVPKFENS
jgi:hypothetical protein